MNAGRGSHFTIAVFTVCQAQCLAPLGALMSLLPSDGLTIQVPFCPHCGEEAVMCPSSRITCFWLHSYSQVTHTWVPSTHYLTAMGCTSPSCPGAEDWVTQVREYCVGTFLLGSYWSAGSRKAEGYLWSTVLHRRGPDPQGRGPFCSSVATVADTCCPFPLC